jgi:lysyl-tRNA synthetase class I
MISSSLLTIEDTLISNPYTRQPYCTAKGLSTTAYRFTVSFQILAPLFGMADQIANKAVDVVESRCPYPFTAKPEDVAQLVRERTEYASQYVRERRQSAVTMANKNFDERVMSPVVQVAEGIDQVCASYLGDN